MGAHDPSAAATSCIDATKDSQSTVEIKIKTLDSQTYTLQVEKSVPIPKLKEQIANITGVISEQQRLICRGKVLKDDEILSTYHIEDGHTLHMVVRQPQPFSSSPSSHMENEGAPGQSVANATLDAYHSHASQGAHTLVFETVNIGQGDHHAHLSQIISSTLNAVATGNTESQTSSLDLRDLSARASLDIPFGELGSRQSSDQFHAAVPLGPQQPTVIPDSLTTIHQYLSFMRDEFFREGAEYRNELDPVMLDNGLQSRHSFTPGGLSSLPSLTEILLSTRELLMMLADGYISQFTRRLEDQAHLTDPLTRGNLQNSVLRSGILLQNLGSLLLELGRVTMTLRFGERPSDAVINAGPAVFISASGPNPVMVQPVPFFPGSNFSSHHMGAAYTGLGLQGEPLGTTSVPGNITIRLRAGRTVPGSPHNLSTQGGQEVQETTNPTEDSSTSNVVPQAVSGASDNPSLAGDSGARVMPIRMMVALPAGVRRSTADPSGSAVGLIYPVLARVPHVTSGNLSDSRGNELSNGENRNVHNSEQQHATGSTIQSQNLESSMGDFIHEINQISASIDSFASGLNASINESASASASHQGSLRDFLSGSQQVQSSISNNEIQFEQQNGQSPISQLTGRLDQWLQSFFPREQVHVRATSHPEVAGGSSTDQAGIGGNSSPEVGVRVSEDGLFFSRLVRNLMPFISQATSTDQDDTRINQSSSTAAATMQNSNDSSSSQSRRDPPDAPSPKRARGE